MLPIGLIVGGLIVAVIVLAFELAQRQTTDAVAVQQKLAKGMIDVRLAQMEKAGNDYSNWDEAFDNLVVRPNAQWADDNIGTSMVDRYGFEMTFVIDGGGRITYGMINQKRSILPIDRVLSGGIESLLAERKQAGPNETRSGLLLASGHPALVTLSPIRPFNKPDTTTVRSRNILVFVDLLDDQQLYRLSAIYQLPNLRLVPAAETSASSNAFTTFDGFVPVRLAWDGADPGGGMLRELLPVIASMLATLALLTVLILWHAASSAKKLDASERRASRDALTDLLNRSALIDDLDLSQSKAAYALLYVDLDGFKQINDTHGHDVGDLVLIEVAKRLTTWAPPRAKIYRLGGDEFAVILWGSAKVPVIREIGERILRRLAEPIWLEAGSVEIGATIGVAIATAKLDDILNVVKKADQALYVGKRGFKGTIRFHVEVAEGVDTLAS